MEAVIFDMDGVVVDSVSRKREHWEVVLAEEFGLADLDVTELIGLNTRDKHAYLAERHGLDANPEAFDRALNDGIERVYAEEVELLPGLDATFEWLAERSVKRGLASAAGRSKVDLVVDRFGLDGPLDAVVSADDIDEPSKPDPAIYRHAASLLSADPASCIAVEDSKHGVTAATEAGLYCLGYNPPDSPDRPIDHADEVVTEPEELHDRVRDLVDDGA